MNIIEAIQERRSVRTYNGAPLSRTASSELFKAINNAYDPFEGDISIKLNDFDLSDGFRPSTYGVIKGAMTYFLVAGTDSRQSELSIGFVFEQIVLKAWQLGLGTCWIGGTFKGSDFDRLADTWTEGQQLRIVSPVGVPSGLSFREKIMRTAVGSDRRKPFEKLFFDTDFATPLSPNSRYGTALEMLRLAPSSTNSQPWRALVIGETVHFYYMPKSKFAVIDCGIGLCHFYETEKFYSHAGIFAADTTAPTPPDSMKYLISYRPE